MKKRKLPCQNPDCSAEVYIRSKGLCPPCRQKQLNKEKVNKSETPSNNKNSGVSYKKPKTWKKKSNKALDKFFDEQLILCSENPYSIESGTRLPIAKFNLAHILPKRPGGGFPSIATNPKNIMFLTLDEHNKYDKLLDEHRFDKIAELFPNMWPNVKIEIKYLLSVATENNKLYIALSNYLNK